MLVDVADYPELDRLRAINPAFDFVKDKSENPATHPLISSFITGGVRFSIAPKVRPDMPDRYGLNIFGESFYKL